MLSVELAIERETAAMVASLASALKLELLLTTVATAVEARLVTEMGWAGSTAFRAVVTA